MNATRMYGDRRPAGGDPMLRNGRVLELEPTRLILEFDPAEFAALDRASRAEGAADYVRKLALRHLARKAMR